MNAADIMTRHVETTRPEVKIPELIQIMVDKNLTGMPVVNEKGQLVGVVTEGDLFRRANTGSEPHHSRWIEFLMDSSRLTDEYVRSQTRQVEDIMTRDVIAVSAATSLIEVAELMQRRNIKHVPVVSDGTCIGIITRADLVRALSRVLSGFWHPRIPRR